VQDPALVFSLPMIAHMLNKLQMHKIRKTQFLNSTMLFCLKVPQETNMKTFVKVVQFPTKQLIVVTLLQHLLEKKINVQNRTNAVLTLIRPKLVFFSTCQNKKIVYTIDETYCLIKDQLIINFSKCNAAVC
jgi:hypothetical protein